MHQLSKKIILALLVSTIPVDLTYAAVTDTADQLKADPVEKIILGNNVESDANKEIIILGPRNYAADYEIVIGKGNNYDSTSGKYIVREGKVSTGVRTSTIIGENNTVTGTESIAIGTNNRSSATANSQDSDKREVLGNGTGKETYEAANAYMFGRNNRVFYTNGLSLGGSNTLGLNAPYEINGDEEGRKKIMGSLNSNESTAVGFSNTVGGQYSVAMGYANIVATKDIGGANGMSVAIGSQSYVGNMGSTSVGALNFVDGKYSAAMGVQNRVMGTHTFLIGRYNFDTDDRSAGQFKGTHAANYSVGLGNDLELHGDFVSNIGYDNYANGTAVNNIGFRNLANGDYSVTMGSKLNRSMTTSLKKMGVANPHVGHFSSNIGYNNANFGNRSVLLGTNSNVLADSAGAIGVNTNVYGQDSYAMGTGANVAAIGNLDFTETGSADSASQPNRALALGSYTWTSVNDGVALGSYSQGTREAGQYGYIPSANMVAANDASLSSVLSEGTDTSALQGKREKIKALHEELDGLQKQLTPLDMKYMRGAYDASEKDQLKADRQALINAINAKKKEKNTLETEVGSVVGTWQGQLGALAVGDPSRGLTRQIIGVAAGKDDADAVNVAQLKDAVKGKVNKDASDLTPDNIESWKEKLGITGDSGKISKEILKEISYVRNEMQAAVSLSGALAALKPLSYNPYDKNQLMFGVGHYRGENSLALGLVHYKNRDQMFHIGFAYNQKLSGAINAGVTLRLGKKAENVPAEALTNSVRILYELETERVKNTQQEKRLAAQEREIQQLKNQIAQLMKTVK